MEENNHEEPTHEESAPQPEEPVATVEVSLDNSPPRPEQPAQQKTEITLETENPQHPIVASTQPVESNLSVPAPVVAAAKLTDFATETLTFPGDHSIRNHISINIVGSVQKGSALSKFTAYSIVGEDEKGKFETCRRYSEFDSLRSVLVERWPGCFIPVLPDKSMVKNSTQVVHERQRLLENFLKCVAYTSQIYYSEEFQIFIRSSEVDVNSTLEKLPKPTLEQIINRYKQVFAELGGKEIGSEASIKISSFKTSLRKAQQKIPEMEAAAVSMAESKDIINEKLPTLHRLLRDYEKNTVVQFAQGNQNSLVYFKETNQEQFMKHEEKLRNSAKGNPFWLFSDLVKLELKDSQSMLDTINIIDVYNEKRLDCQNQIRGYEQEIEELTLGRSTMSSMTTRKPKEEVRKNIEEKNKKCIVEKHQYMELSDMVVALLAYMQIDNYKNMKKRFYSSILRKFAGYEGFIVLTLSKMWNDLGVACEANLAGMEKNCQNPIILTNTAQISPA